MEPPINPSTTIDDPTDFKPDDWVDTKRITDETATKPDDWDEDEPEKIPDSEAVMPSDWLTEESPEIPDPSASMPDDWDEDEDGEWEAPTVKNAKCFRVSGCGPWSAPLIENPKYKGKWYAPLIDNPDYIGEWKAKQIENPYWFEDKKPLDSLAPISGIAIEIWTMTGGIRFDNIIITESEVEAVEFAHKTWKLKTVAEKNNRKLLTKEERREDLERKRLEGGFVNLVEVYLNDFVEVASENLLVFMSSLLFGLVGLVFICTRGGNSKEGDEHERMLREQMNADAADVTRNNRSTSDSSDDRVAEEEEEEDESDGIDENDETLAGTAKKTAKEEAEKEVAEEEKNK